MSHVKFDIDYARSFLEAELKRCREQVAMDERIGVQGTRWLVRAAAVETALTLLASVGDHGLLRKLSELPPVGAALDRFLEPLGVPRLSMESDEAYRARALGLLRGE